MRIAKAMSVSDQTVGRVFRADLVGRALVTGSRGVEIAKKPSILSEIAASSRNTWGPLAEAASKREWTRDETRLAVQNLKSDRVPQTVKRDILAGRADPVAVNEKGEFAIPTGAIGRKVKELRKHDVLLALYRALEVAGQLQHLDMAKLADAVAEDGRLSRVTDEVESQVEIWKELLTALKRVKGRKLEVVS